MFTDLHEGILELFAEAQQRSKREQLLERRRVRRAKNTKESEASESEDIRVLRAVLRRTFQPPRPRVELVACPRCASMVEWREGCPRPVVHPCNPREGAIVQ